MWIELHQSLHRHPKTIAAAAALGVTRFTLVGHLSALWCWALDTTGREGGPFTAPAIAAGAEWADPATAAFVDALVAAGFVDERPDGLFLHDWDDYAGKLLDQRELRRASNREAQRRRRQRLADDVSALTQRTRQRDNDDSQHSTVPNQTKPNLTEPDQDTNHGSEEKPKLVRRAKGAPALTAGQRDKLVAKYLAPAGSKQRVEDEIDLALSHKNAKNYERTDLYVDGWLRRGLIGEGTTRSGTVSPNGRAHGGQARASGMAAAGASPGESGRAFEGPPRPTSALPLRPAGDAAPVARTSAS